MVKESFEDLLMGNVSENVGEDNEAFDERLKQVQAALAKNAKDEKASKSFDGVLSKVIGGLPQGMIQFISFLLNHEVPSLTILAVLSLINEKARTACQKEFQRFVGEEGADFSGVGFSDKKVGELFSVWWTLMILADHHSLTTRLKDVDDKKFHEAFWGQVDGMTNAYIERQEGLSYNSSLFEKKKKQYMGMLYR